MGGESVMVTLVGRGKYVPSRRNRRVPANDTGMIGAPLATAALKAPSWNGRTPSSAVKVPSGKINTDSPLRKNSSIRCAWRNRDSGSVRSNLKRSEERRVGEESGAEVGSGDSKRRCRI